MSNRMGVMVFPYTTIHIASGHTLTDEQRRCIRRLVTYMEPMNTTGWLITGPNQAPLMRDGSFHTSGKFSLQATLKKVTGGSSLTFAVRCGAPHEIRTVMVAEWGGVTIYTTSKKGLLKEVPQAKIIETIVL